MGVNIGRVGRVLNWIKSYAYIHDDLLGQILGVVQASKQFKLLRYLTYYDHTYFNRKQWPQLKKEMDILKDKHNIPCEIIIALYDCLEDVKKFPDQYFSFIGD